MKRTANQTVLFPVEMLTVILYLIMYMLMFSGAIALRYKMKKAGRPFRIGKGGNGLMWLIGGLGFCGDNHEA